MKFLAMFHYCRSFTFAGNTAYFGLLDTIIFFMHYI
jgi:hypothetical protein